MTTADTGLVAPGHRAHPWLPAAASVIGGVPVGLLSTSFGLFYPWLIAVAAVVLGAVVRRREFWVVTLGVVVGTAGWWLLALLNMNAGDPPVGSGSG
ncbi:MAG: hypothetical protein QM650_00730 [Microlunatus sp.]